MPAAMAFFKAPEPPNHTYYNEILNPKPCNLNFLHFHFFSLNVKFKFYKYKS